MAKKPWDRIWDLIFTFYWYAFNIILVGLPWFLYRVQRKAVRDAFHKDEAGRMR